MEGRGGLEERRLEKEDLGRQRERGVQRAVRERGGGGMQRGRERCGGKRARLHIHGGTFQRSLDSPPFPLLSTPVCPSADTTLSHKGLLPLPPLWPGLLPTAVRSLYPVMTPLLPGYLCEFLPFLPDARVSGIFCPVTD